MQDISDVCRVIERCLEGASFLSIYDNYNEYLRRGMTATGDIILLCLSVLERVEHGDEVERVLQDGLLSKVIEYLDADDITLATRASKVIQALHENANPEQKRLIEGRLSVSSSNKHRLIDLMQKLSITNGVNCFKSSKGNYHRALMNCLL